MTSRVSLVVDRCDRTDSISSRSSFVRASADFAARHGDRQLVTQLTDRLLLDPVATDGPRSPGARRAMEDLGDLLESALRVQACVADPLQLESRRVAIAQGFEQALSMGLAQLFAFGQLGLQRPQLG